MPDLDARLEGSKQPDHLVTQLLQAIEADSRVSQRQLASHLGVALGLVNAYVKHCVSKGWIKVSSVPPRRFGYYLTPQGFAEKSRRTAEFLSVSLQFFRRARIDCGNVMQQAANAGWQRIWLRRRRRVRRDCLLCANEKGLSRDRDR